MNCGTGVTCSIAQSNTAYCNRCNFPFTTRTCDSIDLLDSNTQICYNTRAVFTGFAFSYTVTELTPFTPYLVYVGVSNSAGGTISPETSLITAESIPVFVEPPTLTVISSTMIRIQWTSPLQPNGVITKYIVDRDGQEIATLYDTTQYTDVNLSAFTAYDYSISACTVPVDVDLSAHVSSCGS